MKTLLLVCVILFFNSSFSTGLLSRFLSHNPPPPTGALRSTDAVSTKYFTQKLDHFDSNNSKTWFQRYYVNEAYFNSNNNNVAFLMLGGEGAAAASWMSHGSWVTSAKKYGALEYYQVVIDDLASNSEDCINSLKVAMTQVDELLLNPSPTENLTSIFNLCEPIEGLDSSHVDVETFYMGITDTLAAAVQYDGITKFGIKDLCEVLTNDDGRKEIFRLSDLMALTYGKNCIDVRYQSQVDSLTNTTTDEHRMVRQWIYQTCNEYGWYQTSNREDNLLGNGCPVDYFTKLCADAYGPEFDAFYIKNRIDITNVNYGGVGINVSNVVYVHGSYDPWHAVGLTETTNPDSPVIVIEGASHCAILYDIAPGELPQLTEAKQEVDRIVGEWLGIN